MGSLTARTPRLALGRGGHATRAVLGVGVDVVETTRVEQALLRSGPTFERRVYTEAEIVQCAGRHDRVQALAARFAAKEAFLKALGVGLTSGLSLREIEVVRGKRGRPIVRLEGAASRAAKARGISRVHLSLSHEDGVAAAVVVLEG